MTLREMAEKAAQKYVGEWDGDECDVYRAMVADFERTADAWLNENLTTCPICSCVRCDALRRKYAARSSGGK